MGIHLALGGTRVRRIQKVKQGVGGGISQTVVQKEQDLSGDTAVWGGGSLRLL